MSGWSVGCAVLVVALGVGPLAPASGQPVFSASQDPVAGSQVFGSKGCVKCHSVNGVGGKVGPDLGRIERPRSFFDLATASWNHLAKMTDRMKALNIARPTLNAKEAGDLIAFLYTLSYFDPPGSPDAGRRLFATKKCVLCHQAGGTGGVVGPNLDGLQQLGSPVYVASALWNHGPAMIEKMRERGVERPTFTGAELRDLIAFLAPRTVAAEGPVYVLPGRAEAGRQLFGQKHCVACHRAGGVGGTVGPDLVGRLVRRSPVEFAAAMWNKAPAMVAAQRAKGIAVPQLSAEEMADLVAYLYSVRYFAEPGTVQAGWAVATSKGCLHCHAVGGERGKPASDLTRPKTRLDSPPAVIAALWNHAVVTPKTPSGEKGSWPQFRPEEMADLVALLQSLSRKP